MVQMNAVCNILRQGVLNRVGGRRVCRGYLHSVDMRKNMKTETEIYFDRKKRTKKKPMYIYIYIVHKEKETAVSSNVLLPCDNVGRQTACTDVR